VASPSVNNQALNQNRDRQGADGPEPYHCTPPASQAFPGSAGILPAEARHGNLNHGLKIVHVHEKSDCSRVVPVSWGILP